MKKIIDFDFILPTKIRYGRGISKQLAAEIRKLGRSRPMIFTDEGLLKAGVVKIITDELQMEGLDNLILFSKVQPNPRDTTVEEAYEIAKEQSADILVAIGGGSSMDTAKAAAVLLSYGGHIRDYEGLDKVPGPVTDLIAIPTTVGTGSEVTFWSVITDTDRCFKMSVGSTFLAPKLALVDPDLVDTLPPSVIASTGMDALTHAIEGYTCLLAEPITDACGIYAIQMIGESIQEAVRGCPDSKANMLMGSLIAGICFGNSDIAGVHCMAEALGGLYDTPHGIANAIMLPFVMEYNYTASLDKFCNIARAMGQGTVGLTKEEGAEKAVKAVKTLNQTLNIPSLKDIGVKKEDLPELARRSAMNVSVESNPRKATEANFLDIFEKAYGEA